MRDLFIKKIIDSIKKNPNIMVLTADLGFGLFDEISLKYPENFINVGVAEQNMINIASGMALEGYKVFTYSIGNFGFMRNLEQIRVNPAYHFLDLNIISNGGGFAYGPLGYTHHATEDIGIMRTIPNITCLAPTFKEDVLCAFKHSLESSNPNYIRLQKFPNNLSESLDSIYIDKPVCHISGDETAIICYGNIIDNIFEAAHMSPSNRPSVYSINQIDPLVDKNWLGILTKYSKIIIVEEHVENCGLGEAFSSLCFRLKKFPDLVKLNIGNKFETIVGSQKYLCDLNNLSVESIRNAISI